MKYICGERGMIEFAIFVITIKGIWLTCFKIYIWTVI